jgi:hypothetical protein
MKTKRPTRTGARKTGTTKVTARKTRARGATATRKPATAAETKPAATKKTGERAAATRKRQSTPQPQSPSRLGNAAEILGALAGRVAAVADRMPWAKTETATSSSKATKNTGTK